MLRTALFVTAAAFAVTPAETTAQAQAQPAAQAAQIDGREVAAAVQRLLNQHYVLPEARPKFEAILGEGIASGRYDVAEPAVLVERLNADLGKVTPDKHLGVMYDPERSAQLAAAPARAGADDAPPSADEIARAERRNHGLTQMRIFPGNIRYLQSDGFFWAGEATARAYDDAMRFLAGGDAVIIDVRGNGGGSPDAVAYLVSHFMEPNRPLMTFYMGADGTQRTSTLADLNAPRMIGKPLYVLTSGRSASAAEEFIGHVAGFKLGELVGETSAGAGFRNEVFPLPGGLMISISVGRAVLAATGKDWEEVGIPPTITADVDEALQVAQLHALRRLASSAAPQEKQMLEGAAALISAQIDPVETALPLGAYAGKFGVRTLALEDGSLTYQRDGAPKFQLVAVGANQFMFEENPSGRVEFAVSGERVTGFDLVRPDGSRVSVARTE